MSTTSPTKAGPETRGSISSSTGAGVLGAVGSSTRWWYDTEGQRHYEADRTPGDVLWAGGLYDAAADLHKATGAPWEPTTGHWSGANAADRMPRRIDGIRVTREVCPALRACETDNSDLARSASDHLPVVVTYDPATFTTTGPRRPR